ncbi:MAG: transglycosylase domain-containing protein [Bacilli bacterium]|nr:transglycosylase domain-containing protein [Bacilli bacterium]
MSKRNNLNKRKKAKLNIGLIITLLLIIACILVFYLFLGKDAAIVLALGVLIIFGIAKLFDMTKKKKTQRVILKTILIIILIFGIVGIIGVGAFMGYVVYSAPEFKTSLLTEKQSTIIYDSNGQEFAKMGSQKRENIEYTDLPEVFIDALIATEDSRYFQHNGVDIARFGKAAFGQVLGHSDAGGGSTISMQVIKNSFTDTVSKGFQGIVRKFTDIYLAVFKLEKQYTKEQIIEFYVNNHNLGDAYGVEEASKYYFNKSAKDLNLSEAAILAGMYQAPDTYNPRKNPEKAEARRKTVLKLMVRHNYITKEEADLAGSIPVKSLLNIQNSNQSVYQGYIDTLRDEIKDKYGLDPNTTSMLIYTNMNREKQDALNKVASGETYSWIDDYVQTGIVAVDSATGKVEALIAARNYNGEMLYNYTTDIKKQIGSTAKPLFDYAPGIEYNNWSTYTLFNDSPYTYSSGQSIKNYDGDYKGWITLRYALSDSRNVPALKAFQQVDKKKVIELVTSVGITPEISGNTLHEAHAIGAFNGSNPMQMAGAYQIFSNGGKYTEPYLVSKIVLRSTGDEIIPKIETKQIISDSTSYMIADVLKGVVTNRMKNSRYHITDNFSVKTGTTNFPSNTWQYHKGLADDAIPDCWVIGFTTKTVVSIWYGYKELDNEHLDKVLHWYPAIRQREDLFNSVANAVFNHDGSDFEMPDSVVKVGIEAGTNPPLLATEYSPNVVYELFKKGTEPTEYSVAHSKLSAPSNLNVSYKNNKVELTWSKVEDPGYYNDKAFGYYIYFNNKLLGFTTKTSYTVTGQSDYLGTYSVEAGYKDTESTRSDKISKVLSSTSTYDLTVSKNTAYLNIGDNIDDNLFNGNIVVLKVDGKAVTLDKSNIKISVKNSSGDIVQSISSTEAETYTITYTVTYKDYTGNISNKIVIKEKATNENDNSSENRQN